MKKPNGYVIYQGPSIIDGSPIVVVAVMKSRNEKTGNMVQTFIMRQDVHPGEALKGADYSVCGDCKHRPSKDGTCYVEVGKSVSAVWKAYHRGSYPRIDPSELPLAGRKIRLGTYGDPAAVPRAVWDDSVPNADGHTGYSHQWLESFMQSGMGRYVMASVDSVDELKAAQRMGYRTFRVRGAEEALDEAEIACPASDEAGNKTQCERCKLCAGTASKSWKNIAIVVHGAKAAKFQPAA